MNNPNKLLLAYVNNWGIYNVLSYSWQGFHRLTEYIVAQMPLAATIVDFWRLVRDFEVSTIVKLNDSHATVDVRISL